jgi:hypothetical protein
MNNHIIIQCITNLLQIMISDLFGPLMPKGSRRRSDEMQVEDMMSNFLATLMPKGE